MSAKVYHFWDYRHPRVESTPQDQPAHVIILPTVRVERHPSRLLPRFVKRKLENPGESSR